ncbi:MAG: MBOAT family O-acyltransferase [Aureispira sp.]
MLFNSLPFIGFFLCFFAVWWWAKRQDQSRWVTLVVFSFLFYGAWDWRFLLLLIFSGSIDYWAGLQMEQQPKCRKLYLYLSLIGNLGSLAIFKYSQLVAHFLDDCGALVGLEWDLYARLPAFSLILPVGISFYTFQSMSYTLDIYRKELRPIRNVWHFFAYLSLFPQLVAGPILRAKDLLYQLQQDRPVSYQGIWFGLRLMAYGFFQKMVIADNLAPFINQAFGNIHQPMVYWYWWLVLLGFAFQIYFDFAGYSAIARGVARLMGYRFRLNFDHPYHARSLQDFWRRWHVSLSTWFRDYVYRPLGGNRVARWKLYRNLWITFLLSALWHGPAYHYLLWGVVHGLGVSLERWTRWPQRLAAYPWASWLAWPLVWLQVLLAWLFFRVNHWSEVGVIGQQLFAFDAVIEAPQLLYYFDGLMVLLLAISIELWYYAKRQSPLLRRWTRQPLYDSLTMGILIAACIYFRGPASDFVYFQF